MKGICSLVALAVPALGLSEAAAHIVWVDHFNDLGDPGTEHTWVAPWPTWTSVGITYYQGTTTTSEGENYRCGSVCLAESDSSEYSFFGSFRWPAATGALGAMLMSGLTLGSSAGYIGTADASNQLLYLWDSDPDSGNTLVGFAPFSFQQNVWYEFRQEVDLSESLPWVRLRVWDSTQSEPVYWNIEGWGKVPHGGEHIIVFGVDTLSTGEVWYDDVGVESQIAPRRVADLSADVSGSDVQLSWTEAATSDSTSIYEGTTAYFRPMPGTETSGISGGSYTVTGAAGDPAVNHFFLVRCVNESGEGPPSNRVGEFDFALETP